MPLLLTADWGQFAKLYPFFGRHQDCRSVPTSNEHGKEWYRVCNPRKGSVQQRSVLHWILTALLLRNTAECSVSKSQRAKSSHQVQRARGWQQRGDKAARGEPGRSGAGASHAEGKGASMAAVLAACST